jgi:hypothetical protein
VRLRRMPVGVLRRTPVRVRRMLVVLISSGRIHGSRTRGTPVVSRVLVSPRTPVSRTGGLTTRGRPVRPRSRTLDRGTLVAPTSASRPPRRTVVTRDSHSRAVSHARNRARPRHGRVETPTFRIGSARPRSRRRSRPRNRAHRRDPGRNSSPRRGRGTNSSTASEEIRRPSSRRGRSVTRRRPIRGPAPRRPWLLIRHRVQFRPIGPGRRRLIPGPRRRWDPGLSRETHGRWRPARHHRHPGVRRTARNRRQIRVSRPRCGQYRPRRPHSRG